MSSLYGLIRPLFKPNDDIKKWNEVRKELKRGLKEDDHRVIREFVNNFSYNKKDLVTLYRDVFHESVIEMVATDQDRGHLLMIIRRLINKGLLDYIADSLIYLIREGDEFASIIIDSVFVERFEEFEELKTNKELIEDPTLVSLMAFLIKFQHNHPYKDNDSQGKNSAMLLELFSLIYSHDSVEILMAMYQKAGEGRSVDVQKVIIDRIFEVSCSADDLASLYAMASKIGYSEVLSDIENKIRDIALGNNH